MLMIDMFYDQLEDTKSRKVPFIIPIGTVEYHGKHASCGLDTMVIDGVLRELGKTKEIVVCPTIWYGVSSYAVAGPESGTIHVDVNAYEEYIYCILKSMVRGGVKNIYCIPHHQTEAGLLMPMSLACQKAAKRVIMEYMEETLGEGWWGSDAYAEYYENLGSADDPFSYIKVLPLMDREAIQKSGGIDHAGKFETSMLMALYPENVDLDRTKFNTEWYTLDAVDSTLELGKLMVKATLESLEKEIV